jgi:hypothetical protein
LTGWDHPKGESYSFSKIIGRRFPAPREPR